VMKGYWLRSSIVTITFLNLCVISIATLSRPTLMHIAWASYFMVLMGLVISHKKQNMSKAMLNFIILLMIGVPISALSMPFALIFRNLAFSAVKANFYILISLISLVYLALRHEKLSIPEAAAKVAVYVGEIREAKLRSSFGRYILGEALVFAITFSLSSYYLFK